jgi:hypothetical protein
MKNTYPYVNKCSVFLKTYPSFYLSFFFRVKYKKIGNVDDLRMTEGEFVPYLPPPEKIVELLEKLDQGVALGVYSTKKYGSSFSHPDT